MSLTLLLPWKDTLIASTLKTLNWSLEYCNIEFITNNGIKCLNAEKQSELAEIIKKWNGIDDYCVSWDKFNE